MVFGFSGCNLYNNLKDKYENITILRNQGVLVEE